jgi:hypothetical protein
MMLKKMVSAVAGRSGIPQYAWEHLAELLVERKREIDRVLAKLPVSS